MRPARAGASAVAAVLGGTVLMLVLVTWAASIGPDEVLRRPGLAAGSSFDPRATSPAPDGMDRLRQAVAREPRPSPPPVWLRVLGVLVEVALAVTVLVAAVRLARLALARWRDRRHPLPGRAQEAPAFEVLDSGPALVRAIEADADRQRAVLEAGEPRNAIVACWDRFETAAEQAGVRRRAWQTPSEFVLEVLARAGAEPEPVSRLAALYREARFSDHPLTHEHRRQAVEALEATHRSLRIPVTRR